jgi:hypothetical protein
METSTPTLSTVSVLNSEANGTANDHGDPEYFYQVEQLTFLWVLFTLIVIGELY